MVPRLSETRGPYSQRRRPANAHPDTQTYRNNRAVFARDRLVVAGDGARTIGADLDQRVHCGDLVRDRRARLGAAGDADRKLDVEAVIIRGYAAFTRLKPFHIAVAAPDISTLR